MRSVFSGEAVTQESLGRSPRNYYKTRFRAESARENASDVGAFLATIETRFQRLLLWDPNS
jgi:hypothetical protein